LGDGTYELGLAKGDEAVLCVGDRTPACEVPALPAGPQTCNYYRIKSAEPKKPETR
jgi:hypothetical protein